MDSSSSENVWQKALFPRERHSSGHNFVLEMSRYVDAASYTLAVLSNNFMASAFTQPEWAHAVFLDPTGSRRNLIPIRIEDVKPAGLLAPIVYIDLVGLDERRAAQVLINNLPWGDYKKPTGFKFSPSHIVPFPIPELSASSGKISKRKPLKKPDDISRGLAMLDSSVSEATTVPPCTLILFDIDGMTAINEKFGLTVGNEVIQHVSEILQQSLPECVCARCGDDSFFAVMKSELATAQARADRAVAAVRVFDWGAYTVQGLWVTLRGGCAQFTSGESHSKTLLRALGGVNNAGRSGGNQVCAGPRYFFSETELASKRAELCAKDSEERRISSLYSGCAS